MVAQKKDIAQRIARRIPPLPGGIVQHREGIERCSGCGAEVIIGRTIDGILIALTCIRGERHLCLVTGDM